MKPSYIEITISVEIHDVDDDDILSQVKENLESKLMSCAAEAVDVENYDGELELIFIESVTVEKSKILGEKS